MQGNQENLRKKNMCIKLVGGGMGIGIGGGGGLAGIILLGGALALVTTFAFKRKHGSKNKQEDSDLSFLVPESVSPHLDNHHDHSPSNGTVHTQDQDEVSTKIILDDNSETNVRNEMENARDNTFCDKSSINKEEFPVPVADSSEVDKETMTADCNQVGDAYDDCQLVLRIHGNNQQQVKAARAQLGLDGKAHEQGEECDGNGNTIIKRKEILVEGAQSNQPGTNDDDDSSHKLDDECDGNGESILEKREEPVEAASSYEKTHMRGKECNVEKGEDQLIGEVVGMILSEELQAITMYGDEDIVSSGGTLLITNETDSCDLKKPKLLIDGPSVIKPGDDDLFEDHLVVEDTKILKGDEANKAPVEDRVVEANGDKKEYCRENSIGNDKFEEADEISVENDQQMQSGGDECQKIHINGDQDKHNCGKCLPEMNSFQSNGEFSFPSLFKPGKLHEYDSAQTSLHVQAIEALAEESFANEIMLENKASGKEDVEAVEMIQREKFQVEKNLQLPQKNQEDNVEQGVEEEEEDDIVNVEEDSYVKSNSHKKLEDDAGDSFMMDKLSADTTTTNMKFWFLSLLVPFLLLLCLSLSQLSSFA